MCKKKGLFRYALQGSIGSSSKNAGGEDEPTLRSSHEYSGTGLHIQMLRVRRINENRFGMVDWTELKRDSLGYLSIAHLPGYILKCLPRLSLRASSLTDIS